MAPDPAALGHIRNQVGRALRGFLGGQRAVLLRAGGELLPGLEALEELLAGGKRLRPAFCYWGWRGAGGPDCQPVLAAAAALELLHASALVHDDVMDGSDTRRGRPSLHRLFAARHAEQRWRGSPEAFGMGAAILLGDLLLSWTDGMYHASGLPADSLRRGQAVLDLMRTEVFAGQYLDLLGQAAGTGTVESALRVVEYKTAKYTIERPLHLGAALAGFTEGPVPAVFSAYGLPLGVAFQLRDDILGVFGDPAQTGKPASDDVREGKRTVLLAIARARAAAAQARDHRRPARRSRAGRGGGGGGAGRDHRHGRARRVRGHDRPARRRGGGRARAGAHHRRGQGGPGRARRDRHRPRRLSPRGLGLRPWACDGSACGTEPTARTCHVRPM